MAEQPSEAELIARGIYDPSAPEAAELLAFIRQAIDRGVSVEAMAEFGPSFAAAKHMLRPGEPVDLAEAARRASIDVDLAKRIYRACGLVVPVEGTSTLTDEDVEVLAAFGAGSQIFGEELILQMVRVIGASSARIAEASVSQFSVSLSAQHAQTPMTEVDIARWNESTISLLPVVVRTLDILIRRHIEARARPNMEFAKWSGVDAVDRAIGFCDLVGYTTFSRNIAPPDLDTAIGAFGNTASDIVVENGGSVVKLIGDEVMFVAPDGSVGCSIALSLAERFAGDELLPDVRLGIAAGEVVLREGDYYGTVVNLAARIVRQAPPGTVLAPASFRDSVAGFTYEDAGKHELKGFDDDVALVVVRR
jgi:adenylate cyclase